MTGFGVFVQDPDAPDLDVLVLGFGGTFALLGPKPNDDKLRVFPAAELVFRRIRFDEPWAAALMRQAPSEPHQH